MELYEVSALSGFVPVMRRSVLISDIFMVIFMVIFGVFKLIFYIFKSVFGIAKWFFDLFKSKEQLEKETSRQLQKLRKELLKQELAEAKALKRQEGKVFSRELSYNPRRYFQRRG